jgi:hypothetical protein
MKFKSVVVCGGSWYSSVTVLRSINRNGRTPGSHPSSSNFTLSFRLVRRKYNK